MKKLIFASAFILFLIATVFSLVFLNQSTQPKSSNQKKSTSSTTQNVAQKKTRIPEVSLASVFSEKATDLGNLDQGKLITLIATGDVIPARGANWPAVKSGNFNYNWEKTADYLKTGDITLINLEAPLMKSCPLSTSGFTFCGHSRHVEGMVFAGVDVANITNNHIGNYGAAGIAETKQILEKNSIGWSGFSRLEIKEVKGVKLGFLGYNAVGTALNRVGVEREIKLADPKVDILVVSIHWGDEYVAVPTKAPGIAPDDPVELGHLIIDAGADLIIGNHPHWVQAMELYKDKYIAFAHGNFIFDQTWSIETQEGVVGEYIFYDKKLISVRYKPIVVDKSYRPVFVEGERAQTILKRMKDASHQLLSNP